MLYQIFYNALTNYLLFNFFYYITSAILFVIDYFGLFQANKIQKSDYLEYYKKCLPCVMINTLFYVILPSFLLGIYEFYYTIPFSILACIFDIVAATILTEIFFYTIHRMLHIPYFYKRYHKQHHQIIAPIGLSAAYMSLVDFYVGNILPIFLPLIILNAHIITIRIWITMITINTVVFAHSGFGIADFHDKHHSSFNKNYGTSFFMDKIFRTNHD